MSTTVLLVDDDADVLDLTATYLRQVDVSLRPVTTTDPDEALALLAEEPVECVVSDYEMPGRDGLALLSAVRERCPDLPFILFTGRGSEEIASEAIAAGVTDYLQKAGGGDQYEVLANRIDNAVCRSAAERRATDLSRINDLLRRVNGRLVRAESRAEVEQVVCDSLTDSAQYCCAWVGRTEPDGGVDVVASAGAATAYAERIEVRHDDTELGRGPVGRALRTGEPQVVEDAAELPVPDWRALAVEYGFSSLAALPLTGEERTHGVLAVHAARPDAFDAEEQDVLGHLADTVAEAIDAAETRRRLRQYETVADTLAEPVYACDADGRFTFVNEVFADLVGRTSEEIVGQERAAVLVERAEPAASGRAVDALRPDGAPVPCEDRATAVDGHEGGTVGLLQEVTDRRARQRLYELATDTTLDAEATCRELLSLAREHLDVAGGKLATVDDAGSHETVLAVGDGVTEGEVVPVGETLCRHVLDGSLVATHDTGADGWDENLADDHWGGECYIGTGVAVDGEPYGSVCFLDDTPRERPFTEAEESFVELVARTVGHELEREAAHDRLVGRERTLRRLQREAASDRPVADRIEAVLELGRDTLGTGNAVLSRVEGDLYEVEYARAEHELVAAGNVFDVAETGCVLTVRDRAPTDIAAMAGADLWADLPVHVSHGMQCYIGTPVYVDGAFYGTLCFEDDEARPEPFDDWERTLVELLAQWVSHTLTERETRKTLERERDRLDEFAGTLSQDLRSPLTVARGRVEVARKVATEPAVTDSLDAAVDALARMVGRIEATLVREGHASERAESLDVGADSPE